MEPRRNVAATRSAVFSVQLSSNADDMPQLADEARPRGGGWRVDTAAPDRHAPGGHLTGAAADTTKI